MKQVDVDLQQERHGGEPVKSAVSEPAVSEPAASEPAASEPAASEPAASEPAVSEPAASEPAVSESAVSAGGPRWRLYVNGLIASEVSRLTRYFNRVVQWQPRHDDRGTLLGLIDCPAKVTAATLEDLPAEEQGPGERLAVLLNGNVNHDYDIEGTLRGLKTRLNRRARVLLITYNPYYRRLYRLANALAIRRGEQPCTFLTHTDLENIAGLSGFQVLRVRPCVYFPWRLLGLGTVLNRLMVAIPLLRWSALTAVIVLRPLAEETSRPSLSVVIPARNERGNIADALRRMASLESVELEVIFVEGHSTDGTWEEIRRVVDDYRGRFRVKAFQQSGKGKADAVRLGFSKAEHDLLTILDADLTMPPELLKRFYDAYCSGLADFVNGSRLVYSMEGGAMRFLNYLGNRFFAKALSFVLDVRLGDSLCGTKLLSRDDYLRFGRWRDDFGDFDPFGDFELLFPASVMGLGVVDVPVRYRQRTYGETNISRFRHGAYLLKMTWIGFWRIKVGTKEAGPRAVGRISENIACR